jgi:predicted DNA-binding ribbon-helix-helix protein
MWCMETSRQSVTLTAPQFAFLKKEAKRLGISVSDLIRRIIDQYREEKA